ncbi:MAG: hypothetical protein H6738_25570, partial [Alphaproteobacteria bacterium]|nr:hypothetical protein [Alphaproteobacteria bacterium]
ADGWHWRFEREAKWFTEDAVDAGGPYASLVQAIDAGVAGGLGLVRQACGVRDTTRKTATEEPVLPGPVGPKPKVVRSKATPPKAEKKPTKAAKPTRARSTPATAEVPPSDDQDAALLAAFAKALDQALVA